jgi:hypothetical protein
MLGVQRTRWSAHVNKRQGSNFLKAVSFADEMGRPLNTFVTLNLHHTPCPPEAVSAAFERLRDNHFTRWLRHRSKTSRGGFGPPAYVWCVENASGHTHVHWLVHVPKPLRRAFEERLPRWVEAVAGAVHSAANAIHVEPADRPSGLARYMMKGIHPGVAKFYKIDHVAQGRVQGKRCGISESLGPAAQSRWRAQRQAA